MTSSTPHIILGKLAMSSPSPRPSAHPLRITRWPRPIEVVYPTEEFEDEEQLALAQIGYDAACRLVEYRVKVAREKAEAEEARVQQEEAERARLQDEEEERARALEEQERARRKADKGKGRAVTAKVTTAKSGRLPSPRSEVEATPRAPKASKTYLERRKRKSAEVVDDQLAEEIEQQLEEDPDEEEVERLGLASHFLQARLIADRMSSNKSEVVRGRVQGSLKAAKTEALSKARRAALSANAKAKRTRSPTPPPVSSYVFL